MNDDDLAELLSLDDSAPKQHTPVLAPVVVRVHRLTESQGLRICKWAKALPRIVVLADVTLPPGEAAVSLLRKQFVERGLDVRAEIQTFTTKDMEKRYPNLMHESLNKFLQLHPWMKLALSYAWAYTAEGMTVTGLGELRGSSAYTSPPEHAWVFEHDCDFAGDVNDLIAAYADDEADLIARELDPCIEEWMWYDCATPSFLHKYGHVRTCVHVHAIRISLRLLRALHEASTAGRIGYGEMAVATVCLGEGLTWRRLHEDHVGTPYSPQGFMSQEDFDLATKGALPKIRPGGGKNRLYHALKW